jgi:hypothetical protein
VGVGAEEIMDKARAAQEGSPSQQLDAYETALNDLEALLAKAANR